jgi:hypothetical protein
MPIRARLISMLAVATVAVSSPGLRIDRSPAAVPGSDAHGSDAHGSDGQAVRRDGLPDLPDPLTGPDGKVATTAGEWRERSRPHQFELLESFVYGRRLPPVPMTVVGAVERTDVTLAGDVPAVRIQARRSGGERPAGARPSGGRKPAAG